MPHALPDNVLNLWDFSLQQYARPGVSDACLRLQDEQGVNVNLLLWCAWLEQRGLRLDALNLRNAHKRIHSWDEHYVVPLRQLRRRMKAEFGVIDAGIEQVRVQIKEAELLAEKQLQVWLEAVAPVLDTAAVTDVNLTGDNVRLYLQQLNVTDAAITEFLGLLSSRPDSTRT